MKQLVYSALCIACLVPGYALAEGAEPLLPIDSRIKWLTYDESDVYIITTRYGYQTNIVFSPDEEIQTISVGDRSLWQIIPAGNRIFIRPMEENIITNMTVLTNRRSYQFDIKSVAAAKGTGNIYVAKFIYPDDRPQAVPAPLAVAEPLPPVIAAPEPLVSAPPPVIKPEPKSKPIPVPMVSDVTRPIYPNYNYTYSGPDDLAPLQVYDDGKVTYIKYQDITQPVPNPYLSLPNGKEKLISYELKDDVMVLDTVAVKFLLKNSNGTVHIYNEMLNAR